MTDCSARHISDEYIDPYIEDLSCNHITVRQMPTPTPTPIPGSGNGSEQTPTPTPIPTATPTPMPTPTATPTPTPTNVGSALIISVPPYAKIFIDTEDTGLITNILIQNIPVGVHTYKLTYPGYTDVDGILFIDLNSMYKLSVIMEKTPGYLDPTKLAIFTIAASMLMVYIVQRKKEEKDHRYNSENIKNDVKRKK